MSNDKIVNELLQLKRKAQTAEKEAYELKGRLSQIETTLKEDFECFDLEEAKALLDQWKEEATNLEESITEGLEKVKADYDL